MTKTLIFLKLLCALYILPTQAQAGVGDEIASIDSLSAISADSLNAEAERLTETDPVRSLRLSEKASHKATILGDDVQLALAMRNKAAVFAYMGQTRDAIISGTKAVNLARTTNNSGVLAKTLNTLAFIHMGREEPKLASKILLEALVLNKSLKAYEQAAKNEINLAILDFYFFSNKTIGIAKLDKIMGWAEVSQNYKIQNIVLTNLAGMAQSDQKPLQAVAYLEKALVCNNRTGNKNERIFNLNQLANLELHLGQTALAEGHMSQALGELGSFTLASAKACTYATAASIYEAKGLPTSALKFYRQATQIYDSLKNSDRAHLQELAMIAVAAERQTAENEALRKDKDLQRQKIGLQRTIIALIGLVLGIVVIMLVLVSRSTKKVHNLVEMLRNKNHSIVAQKEEIQAFNGNLEKLVEERTHKLEKRTRQVLEYASYNSHIVRGPLARILGLAYLLQHTDSETDARMYTIKMEESAREVDEAIKAVSRKLELDEGEYTNHTNVPFFSPSGLMESSNGTN